MVKNCSDSSITIASWIRRLSLSLLLVGGLSCPSWGQEVKNAEIIGTPRVDKDRGRVTLRVKVKDANNRPVVGLQKQDFTLKICQPQGESNNNACQTLDRAEILDWKNPKEAEPPPAWIIVLLDFSGSMKRSDSSGTTKISGALQALEEFNQDLARRAGETKIAIVPFSKGGKRCTGNRVTDSELNNFEDASKIGLEKYLQDLESQSDSLCGATDIYRPVRKAVRFLGNRTDTRFNPPEDSNEPEPRLSIVLLSDGYHSIYHGEANEAELEQKDFDDLLNLLNKYPQITIHTLGYGLTPQQLQAKYNLSRYPTIADVGKVEAEDFTNPNRLAQMAVPAEEFVDQKRLQQIARATGAIAEFAGNAEDIAENLTEFLEALLGEYEISYIQPRNNADRGSEHNVTVAVKTAGNAVASDAKTYVFPWVGPALPASRRKQIILSVLGLLAMFGVVPFVIWAKSIKG